MKVSFIRPLFKKGSSTTPCFSSCFDCFRFGSCLQLSRHDTPLLHKIFSNIFSIALAVARQLENQSWASNFALFSRKSTLFIDQSAFSKFALYFIGRKMSASIKLTWQRGFDTINKSKTHKCELKFKSHNIKRASNGILVKRGNSGIDKTRETNS